MRIYHKSWQSDRPLKTTSRRVKWYQGDGDIRLEFMDPLRKVNHITTDRDEATRLYESFISGDLDTADILDLQESS